MDICTLTACGACIEDSKGKGKKGLCILCAAKKKPFLADPKFLKYKGFAVSDEADNGIGLWYLPFDKKADIPRFKECAKHPHTDVKGYVLYYTSQCPFNAKYVPVLEQTAKENDIPFQAIHIKSKDELDVKRYGVIVTKGYKRGLLLPNLDGVDTVDEQVAIALRKAGLSENEKGYSLQRFEVVRHI